VASIFKLEESEAKELMGDVARKYIETRGLAKYVHELLLQQSMNSHFSVGDAAWDTFLGDGLPTRGITEIVGPAGSGKTQLALQLTLAAQLPKERGGLGGSKSNQYL
jgi:RecA/RadA recombinase